METSIPYSSIQDVNEVTRWDAGHKYCLRITVSDGSVLIQVVKKRKLLEINFIVILPIRNNASIKYKFGFK